MSFRRSPCFGLWLKRNPSLLGWHERAVHSARCVGTLNSTFRIALLRMHKIIQLIVAKTIQAMCNLRSNTVLETALFSVSSVQRTAYCVSGIAMLSFCRLWSSGRKELSPSLFFFLTKFPFRTFPPPFELERWYNVYQIIVFIGRRQGTPLPQ